MTNEQFNKAISIQDQIYECKTCIDRLSTNGKSIIKDMLPDYISSQNFVDNFIDELITNLINKKLELEKEFSLL